MIRLPLVTTIKSILTALEPKERTYSIIMDSGTETVVAIEPSFSTAALLAESLLDTAHFAGISGEQFEAIKRGGPHTYPEWSYRPSNKSFRKTNPTSITSEMRARAVFAAEKGSAISEALQAINRRRRKLHYGLWFQELIYTQKEQQARALKAADFDESRAGDITYVRQYADDRGISLRDAAEDILFHALLFHEQLVKTERLRLSLFRQIKAASTSAELASIMEALKRDGTV